MNRHHAIVLLLGILALALCAIPAGTTDSAAADPEPVPAVAETGPSDAPVKTAPLSPCAQAIQAVLDREAARLVELEVGAKAAAGDQTVLAVQREIEQVKQDTELQILRVQADFARREGRLEQAAQIEAALAEMTAPRPASHAATPAARTPEAPNAGAQR